ncbi:hypothetical protein F5Y09DRAFT_302835 [Xylaria sp. FL1042]|nr:hypothetical protein F5Y09DRAFT_302835 [Xylaria sp. FL1042]
MTHAPPRRSCFEIPLSSKPRDYRPGDGPALAPVSLSLDHDTNAFIVDKHVLPGKPVNNDLKLELYYIVSWPDFPNARVAILATKILDYVSPRTLEDWEYQRALERDEEEEQRLAAERRIQEQRAKIHAASTPGTGTGTSTPLTPGLKKRGRPSKAELVARRLAEQASFGRDELANVPLPPAKTDGPSLSTPKKKLAQGSEGLDELDDADMNEIISRQLQGSSERDSDSFTAEELDEIGNSGAENGFTSLNAFLSGPSSRGYAEFLVSNPPSSAQHAPIRSTSPTPFSLHHNSKETSSRQKTQLTTPIPVPSYPKQTWKKKTLASQEKTITPIPAPWYPPPRAKLPQQKHVVTTTPVPTPSYPSPKPKPHKIPHEIKYTPVPPPRVSPTRKSEVSQPHKVTYTPVPLPSLLRASEKPNTVAGPRVHPPLAYTSNVAAGLRDYNGFTPAGHKKRRTSFGTEAEVGRNDQPHSPSKSTAPTARTSSSRKRKVPQPEEDQEWEVKRLEDDKVLEISGKLVRYFKVRWKGNWPPDQNPTWEPEENVSEALVKNYLKNKTAKEVLHSPSPRKLERPMPTLKRKYSSVAEAFEGDVNDVSGPSSSLPGNVQGEEDDDDYADELFQVTEQRRTRTNTPSQKLRTASSLINELAASFWKS